MAMGMKKAKSLIYDFIIVQNPGTKREALYKKVEDLQVDRKK